MSRSILSVSTQTPGRLPLLALSQPMATVSNTSSTRATLPDDLKDTEGMPDDRATRNSP
jgi:hypothetical protein